MKWEGDFLQTSLVSQLMEGLEKEIVLYEKVLSLSSQENEMLRMGEPLTKVCEILPVKAGIIQQISSVDSDLLEAKKFWETARKAQDQSTSMVKSLVKRLEILIRETLNLDEENQALFTERMDKVKYPHVFAEPKITMDEVVLRAKNAYK